MSRRVVVLTFGLFLLLGSMATLAPSASAAGSWTTLSRSCRLIAHGSDRVRGCVSIMGGFVDEQLTIRARCRAKMLTFEATSIEIDACWLGDTTTMFAWAAKTAYAVTGLTVKAPRVLCSPTLTYIAGMHWDFPYPDTDPGSYGIETQEWANANGCSPPAA